MSLCWVAIEFVLKIHFLKSRVVLSYEAEKESMTDSSLLLSLVR